MLGMTRVITTAQAPSEHGEGSSTFDAKKAPLPAHRAGYPLGGGWGEGHFGRGVRVVLPRQGQQRRNQGWERAPEHQVRRRHVTSRLWFSRKADPDIVHEGARGFQ